MEYKAKKCCIKNSEIRKGLEEIWFAQSNLKRSQKLKLKCLQCVSTCYSNLNGVITETV